MKGLNLAYACVLIAEDDEDDQQLIAEAWKEAGLPNELHFVQNGEELLHYLNRQGQYCHAEKPGLIFLDWYMPKMNGQQALVQMQANPALCHIPVVVCSTTKPQEAESEGWCPEKRVTWQSKFLPYTDLVHQLSHHWKTYFGPLDTDRTTHQDSPPVNLSWSWTFNHSSRPAL